MTDLVNSSNAKELLRDLDAAFSDIPFGNSAFQTEMFVIAAQITPERAYRQIGMQLSESLQLLVTSTAELKQAETRANKIQEKLEQELSYDDRAELEIALFVEERGIVQLKKKITDQTAEATLLYRHFCKYPRYTRAQFEAGERLHYEQRLTRQIMGIDGSKDAYLNMNDDVRTMENFTAMYARLTEVERSEMLNDLSRKSLANYLELPIHQEK